MESELILEPKKTVGVKVPLTVWNWLDSIARRQGTGKGNIVLKWIIEKYKASKTAETAFKPASELPPGKEVQARTAEDSHSEFKSKSEKGHEIEVLDEEAILKRVGHLPRTITKNGLRRFLMAKGYDERTAKQVEGILIVNGTYEEKGNWLYLKKEFPEGGNNGS